MELSVRRCLGSVLLLAGSLSSWSWSQAASQPSDAWKVQSARETDGKLQIVLRDGRSFVLPLAEYQCSFDDVQIAPDGMTVGWIEGGSLQVGREPPCLPHEQFVADGPIVWRAGKIIRRFKDWGGSISWSFYGNSRLVAVHAGPEHMDDAQACVLYDLATGRALKRWGRADKTSPPDWAVKIIDE